MLLLVGLDNPQSSDPKYALFPRPANCAGHRLLKMIQLVDPTFNEKQYISLMRTNLFPVGMCPKAYRQEALTRAGQHLVAQLENSGMTVVLLGADVRTAVTELGSDWKMCVFYELRGSTYTWLPHPSGRNRALNDKKVQRKVGRFLRDLIKQKARI